MHLFRANILCALIVLCAPAAHAANEILADPPAITPGQTTTLKWYFTGDKVTVSGGRFGRGTVVTGRQKLTDTPTKTTRYTYDVYYKAPATLPDGRKVDGPQHAHYEVVVNVVPMPSVAHYHAACGWQVDYLSGWKRAQIPTPDQPKDGLVFFQQEDDAVERLAVAAMPAKEMTTSDLIEQVKADMPTHYNDLKFLTQEEITYLNAPAIYITFAGVDQAHPETRTQSLILAFVRDGQAYVVSARTTAAHFNTRRPILERLVKSFAVGAKTAQSGSILRTASNRQR